MLSLFLVVLLSYLLGSLPTSILVGRLVRGIDIRHHGSGNAGGTNTFRVLGWAAGLVVAIVDVGKGTLAVLVVADAAIPGHPISLAPFSVQMLAGLAAILGHIWTAFAGFRGGKGVGTAAGVLIGLYPPVLIPGAVVFFTTAFTTGIVSLSSLVTALSMPLALLVMKYGLDLSVPPHLLAFTVLLVALVFYTHRSNLRRLRSGTENRFGRHRRRPNDSTHPGEAGR